MTPESGNTSFLEYRRLFIAIPVPDGIQRSLSKTQDQLRQLAPNAKIRWAPREQMHLTIKFLGDVPESQLEGLQSALLHACAGHSKMELCAVGLGAFPHFRNPRVIWAGVHENEGRLLKLWKAVTAAVSPFTAEQDENAFSAHVTLGRIKFIRAQETVSLKNYIAAADAHNFGGWSVEKCCLMQSRLGAEGAEHALVQDCELC